MTGPIVMTTCEVNTELLVPFEKLAKYARM